MLEVLDETLGSLCVRLGLLELTTGPAPLAVGRRGLRDGHSRSGLLGLRAGEEEALVGHPLLATRALQPGLVVEEQLLAAKSPVGEPCRHVAQSTTW